MPSLIRFVVVLLVLAGVGLVGMVGLAFFVDPGTREISYEIPARDLWGENPALDPGRLLNP